MQKILHVITSMDPKHGGVREVVNTYGLQLQDDMLTSEVVSFDREDLSKSLSLEYKHIGLGESIGPLSYNSKFRGWLKKNAQDYSHVIVHGLWSYHSYQTVNTLSKLKEGHRPLIFIMPHGMLDPWFQQDKSRKLKALRNYLYWNLIEKNTVNKADGLLFTCENELKLAKLTFSNYRPKNTYNVGYGIRRPPVENIDSTIEFKRKHDIREPYLLFLSRIDPKKGIDLLIAAYTELSKSIKLPRLLIAGDTASDFAKEMIERASATDQITFLGMLKGDEKWSAIYNAEAFILPSHQENFGIAIVESLACSVPVIITKKINIHKEIIDGRAGMLCEDDLNGCKKILKKWSATSELDKAKMKKNAMQTFEDFFKIEDRISKLREVL